MNDYLEEKTRLINKDDLKKKRKKIKCAAYVDVFGA